MEDMTDSELAQTVSEISLIHRFFAKFGFRSLNPGQVPRRSREFG